MESGRRSGVLLSLSVFCVLLDLQLDGVLGASAVEIEEHLEMGRKLLAAGQLAEALSHYHSAVEGDPKNYLTYYKRAAVFLAMGKSKGNILLKQGSCQEAREDFEAVSRELRADCYIRLGDPQKAIQDLAPTTRLRNDNRAAFLKLSRLHYSLGEHHESLRFEDAIEKYESVMKTEPYVSLYTNLAKARICFCLVKLQEPHEAIDMCSEAHQRDPRNAQVLRDRAEAFILNQEYEKAVEDYQEAREFDKDSNEIREGLERAQKLLKLSRKRDYYKILGVNRSAGKQEIIKAYRKLAQQWHPDNFQSETEKKEAEKRFIDIASAKEVLIDPEMRQKFDSGEDPLDPENQQGGGGGGQASHGWPFHFNPFESGGNFHFKFQHN
ncbi:hypothetical protein CRUP_016502 [Coryphaenoides rupestris]|nr:hypothetical protein CRUP_016502 [Coryphaenoides rupestris]